MSATVLSIPSKGVLRFSHWDALFIALAGLHGVILAAWPTATAVAIGVWWNANTIAHNFIHLPFFRARFLNLVFSAYLSVLLGIPQSLWRDRHLAHHAGVKWRLRVGRQLLIETILVIGLWTMLALLYPRFLLTAYLPGHLIGLGLCALQGRYEHARGATSHYGSIYNLMCFNDGYHVEHHANPAVHWSALRARVADSARVSRWPALLRWLESAPALVALEEFVLRSRGLQRLVLRNHRRAFVALLPYLPPVHRVAIVGGGLFPRTAIILRELLPGAEIVIIDASARNLETARGRIAEDIELVNERFECGTSCDCDLVVIPLSFEGDRKMIYLHPPARAVLVHDWIWRRRGRGAIVSAALLKRLNLVMR